MGKTITARHPGYLSLVHRCPKLSREREVELARLWRRRGDTAARDELVRSQLRHVVTIARRYRRESGATLDELIAEGNFGLLQAMAKFDPDRGIRFVSYAVYWIRAYISQYLLRSRSLVTTGVHSKLLAKIRRERHRLTTSSGEETDTDERVAERLAISPEKLRSLAERLEVRDVSWEASAEETSAAAAEAFETPSLSPEERALSTEAERQTSIVVSGAVASLSERERFVIEWRHLAYREDRLCLAEIARRFRVSRERARQIEASAMRKLKNAIQRSPAGCKLLAYRAAA